jgi:hypothetical protein
MIPAIRELTNSSQFGTDSDVSMTAADSILGKRPADVNENPGQKLDLSLVLNLGGNLGGKSKKGRPAGAQGMQDAKKGADGVSVATRTRRKTASGQGVPRNLTRSEDGSRQEQ